MSKYKGVLMIVDDNEEVCRMGDKITITTIYNENITGTFKDYGVDENGPYIFIDEKDCSLFCCEISCIENIIKHPNENEGKHVCCFDCSNFELIKNNNNQYKGNCKYASNCCLDNFEKEMLFKYRPFFK